MTAGPSSPAHVRVGEYDCYSLPDGFFRLDGGAMFGVAPKALWGRFYEADADNRIRLACRALLVAGKGIALLVEGGAGDVFDGNEKLMRSYAIESTNRLDSALGAIGYAPGDITHAVFSHLHWDHAGTACRRERDGRFVPRFPKARYVVQRGEWDAALSKDPLTAPSYIPEALVPVRESGQLDCIDGDGRINDDIRLVVTGGHTENHMALMLESGGERLVFWGDIIPTSHHIHLPLIMAYDRFPVDTYRVKERLLADACRENAVSAFPHDCEVGFGRISFDGKRYRLAEGL